MELTEQQIINRLQKEITTKCRIIHSVSGEPGYSIDIQDGVVAIGVGGDIEEEMYLDLHEALKNAGMEEIRLETVGLWLGKGKAPEKVMVTDHIACHADNILTGSEAASKGEAFIDMRGVYKKSEGGEENILWHLENGLEIGGEERKAAMEAGCSVASDRVVPWVIGAKAAGVGISVVVEIV